MSDEKTKVIRFYVGVGYVGCDKVLYVPLPDGYDEMTVKDRNDLMRDHLEQFIENEIESGWEILEDDGMKEIDTNYWD